MKFYLLLSFYLLTPNVKSQIVKIFPLDPNLSAEINIVKDILKRQYNFQLELNPYVPIQKKGDPVDCSKLNNYLNESVYFHYDKSRPIKIYLTNTKLIREGKGVRGVSYGNEIYLNTSKRTEIHLILIHELSHTFGLDHCSNKCIMNISLNPKYECEIWDQKFFRPIFCENCLKIFDLVFQKTSNTYPIHK